MEDLNINELHSSVERLKALREEMCNTMTDWIIIYTQDSHMSEMVGKADRVREYFSGFTGSAGTLLVGTDEAMLWTDSRYYIQAMIELDGSGIVLMKDGEENVPSIEEYIASHVWEGQRIGIDFKTISLQQYYSLREKLGEGVELIDGSSIVRKCYATRPKRVFNDFRVVAKALAGRTFCEKISQIRQIIEADFVEEDQSYSYIVSDLCSIMWILNLRGSDIEYVPVGYSYLVVNQNSVFFYCNKKAVGENIKSYLFDEGIIVREYGNFYNELEDIATDVILLDKRTTNAAIYEKVKEYCSVIYCDDCKIVKKHIKNEAEIEGMRAAHLKDAAVMISFIVKLKKMINNNAQITELAAGRMLDEMRMAIPECIGLSFETICAYGKNAAIVHYSADENNNTTLQNKGMLLVDSGGQYEFGTTDITRTIVLGELTAEEKHCYTVALKGHLRLLDAVFAKGTRGSNIDIIARDPIWRSGYDFGHGTGHGIGCCLSVHEGPVRISFRAKDDMPLEKGVVVSDEPGIYIENQFGIRHENAVLVNDKKVEGGKTLLGFEPLSLVPFERDAINICELDDYEIDILNRYHNLVLEKVGPLVCGAEHEFLQHNAAPVKKP